ncbi:helix-turn-helix domain-containing protein [Eggerthella sinensis]|uniref:helix-turn-helix domain-containing protein n=1 Tax=Eggerthella sinensis TaxID=242230 RepID=UPI00266CF797|nr:helix-turn-helix domain-containing protein [Eggerthella sinensis]
MDTDKLLLNPARLRIMQYLRLHGRVRTSDLVAYLDDVPRATVYHHVKLLEEHGMIAVVEEHPVRGVVERVYALAHAGGVDEGDVTVALSTAFHAGLMRQMNDYLAREDHDCARDLVFFSTAVFNLDDVEYRALLDELAGVLRPYLDRAPAAGRAQRSLSLISSPPEGGRA